jgi:hypothetical protein
VAEVAFGGVVFSFFFFAEVRCALTNAFSTES